MTKQGRLKHLTPAARMAQIIPYGADGVLIKTRYVQIPHECLPGQGNSLISRT